MIRQSTREFREFIERHRDDAACLRFRMASRAAGANFNGRLL
jgi:hypothetical protein